MRVLAFSMIAFLMLALSPASALKVLVMAHRSHTATILPHAQAGGRRVAESEAVRCLSESEAAACLVRFCLENRELESARSILNQRQKTQSQTQSLSRVATSSTSSSASSHIEKNE